MLRERMYNILFLVITLHMLTTQGIPLNEARLQNLLHSDSVIFTREEAEAVVNQSQSYGTSCDSRTSNSFGHLPIYVRSLCPWYYELVHWPGFFPSYILKAKLRCTEGDSPCMAQNPLDYTCVNVWRAIRMTNETCEGDNCEVIQKFRVGAKCVKTQSLTG